MASTRNVVVNFITKLSSRGIDNFGKQSRGLERSLGLLQKRLVALVGFGAFFRFIKTSTKAFAEETGQVKQLELALNNLGFAYSALNVENTIANLQRLTAVADSELRPALAQLVRQVGNVTKATELLELAINVSLGSGKSLATVSRALGRAFDGQTTALRRLDAGISAAAIESKDFNRIQAELEEKFGGAAAASLDTYAGKMRALAVASEDAREKIGEGVVKGIEALGRGDFQKGVSDLVVLAEKIGRGFELAGRGVARIREFLNAPLLLPGNQRGLTAQFLAQDIALDAAERKAQIREIDRRYKVERKAIKTLAADKAKERTKDQAEDRRKAAVKAAEARDEQLKKRLAEKFDIDAINLQAALTRKLSEEDKARVQALQAIRTDAVKDDKSALEKLIELERKRTEDALAGSIAVRNQRLSDLEAEYQALLKIAGLRATSIPGRGGTTPGGFAGSIGSTTPGGFAESQFPDGMTAEQFAAAAAAAAASSSSDAASSVTEAATAITESATSASDAAASASDAATSATEATTAVTAVAGTLTEVAATLASSGTSWEDLISTTEALVSTITEIAPVIPIPTASGTSWEDLMSLSSQGSEQDWMQGFMNYSSPSITVNISGSVISERDLFEAIQNELFAANRAGIPGQLELLGR